MAHEHHLSKSTKDFIDGLCFASNFFWTEAGMSYEEALNSLLDVDSTPSNLRETLPSDHNATFHSSAHDQLLKLTRFLNGALGHNTDVPSNFLPISAVRDGFLRRLNADLNADWFTSDLVECEFGMDLQLSFADERNQVVHVLKMKWRID